MYIYFLFCSVKNILDYISYLSYTYFYFCQYRTCYSIFPIYILFMRYYLLVKNLFDIVPPFLDKKKTQFLPGITKFCQTIFRQQ